MAPVKQGRKSKTRKLDAEEKKDDVTVESDEDSHNKRETRSYTSKRRKIMDDQSSKDDGVTAKEEKKEAKPNKRKHRDANSKENEPSNEANTTKAVDIKVQENPSVGPEVDIECVELSGKVSVYVDTNGGHCYDVMLNQTNIQQNNNKFYLMQVLHNNVSSDYWVWFRWGRVGFRGQSSLTPFGSDLQGALKMFHSKFAEKTRNAFLTSKSEFRKVPGKYDLIRIDYSRKVVNEQTVETKQKIDDQKNLKTDSNKDVKQMDDRVKTLMSMICDLKAMERDARKLDYDFKRIPLGKITKEQIHAGYEALTRIEGCIKQGSFGAEFTDAVNEYYTRIPHSFGMRTPTMIKTQSELKQEIELLELLTGIEITVAEIGGDPLERHYSRLQWDLVPLEKSDQKFKMVEEYLLATQGPTHNRYSLQLRTVFELKQKTGSNAAKRFRAELGNRKLLWHGSRLANWYSILAQGLRIAPPEAPITGYMFGKGAYFADISSKSANYSLSDPGRPGFLLLSEVALGEVLELRDPDDQMHHKLPEGKHSVKGVGRYIPNPDEKKMLDDSIEVPCGKPIQNTKAESDDDASLIYNEFIVYSLDQIRERFLVEVEYKFDFEL